MACAESIYDFKSLNASNVDVDIGDRRNFNVEVVLTQDSDMMERKINHRPKAGGVIENISRMISGTDSATCTETFKLRVLDIEVNGLEV
jgi:hypothetical protein